MTDAHVWIWIRIGSALHLVGAGILLYLWKNRFCYARTSSKTPIFIVLSSWYGSISLFISYNEEIISYDYLRLHPIIPMALTMTITSILFIWFWNEINKRFCDLWCN